MDSVENKGVRFSCGSIRKLIWSSSMTDQGIKGATDCSRDKEGKGNSQNGQKTRRLK